MGNPGFQIVFISIALFGLLYQVVGHPVGRWLVIILGVTSFGIAAVLYIRKFMPRLESWLYARPGSRHFIDFVCAVTGEQRPTGGAPPGGASEAPGTGERTIDDGISLKTAQDFRAAASSLLKQVRGHDTAIRGMMAFIERSVALRRRRGQREGAPPLGVFIIAGAEGIGRRHLATQLAAHIFTNPGFLHIRGTDYADVTGATTAIFGSGGQAGSLVAAVRALPRHVVFIEGFDALPPRTLVQLRDALRAGSVTDEAGRSVSFEDTVIILATSSSLDLLRATDAKELPADARAAAFAEAIAQTTTAPPECLDIVAEYYVLTPPSRIERAKVLLLLMKRICADYNVELEYVDASILAAEVTALPQRSLFESAPERLRRRLAPEIAELARKGRRRLVWSGRTPVEVRGADRLQSPAPEGA